MTKRWRCFHLIVAFAMLAAGAGCGRETGSERTVADASGEDVVVELHDLELVDQDGNKVKFKSDVIGGRVAVIIPFYTTCPTSYPILIFMLARLQALLGDQLGKEVVLVSVTVDPSTDIPLRLKAYARRQKARPGWVFLTGEGSNPGRVLWGAGLLRSPRIEEHDHIPVTLVGSDAGGWRRFHGFPSPEQIMARVSQSLGMQARPDAEASGSIEAAGR